MWPASFDLQFFPNRFKDGTYQSMTNETVVRFLSNWRVAPHLEITNMTVHSDARLNSGGYKFEITIKYLNLGNAGQAIKTEGYLLVHPFDPDYLVMICVDDKFDIHTETPDPMLHQLAEDWISSIAFSDVSPVDRKLMRENGSWIKPAP